MTSEEHEGSREAEEEMREASERTRPSAAEMEKRSEELKEEIENVELDWERKREDRRVPGAQPDLEDVETERQDLGGAPGGEER